MNEIRHSECPEDFESLIGDSAIESEVICPVCNSYLWQVDWWDSPPEHDGAIIGYLYKCGNCDWEDCA